MSSRERTPSTTESFVDAEETVGTAGRADAGDKDTLKEEPLSTPNHSQTQPTGQASDQPSQEEEEKKSNVVTIFDVATEIENMLNEISSKIEENDQLVQEKIEKINKTIDKIERKMNSKKV